MASSKACHGTETKQVSADLHPTPSLVRELTKNPFSVVSKLETPAATTPMKMDGPGPTNPAAGVIATRPQMAPVQNPTADHLRSRRKSRSIQLSPPMPAARLVLTMARPALTLAAIEESCEEVSEREVEEEEAKRRRTESRSSVEAEPADPEEDGTLDDEGDVVRLEGENRGAKAATLACWNASRKGLGQLDARRALSSAPAVISEL